MHIACSASTSSSVFNISVTTAVQLVAIAAVAAAVIALL
jgi:hypothetical protein